MIFARFFVDPKKAYLMHEYKLKQIVLDNLYSFESICGNDLEFFFLKISIQCNLQNTNRLIGNTLESILI